MNGVDNGQYREDPSLGQYLIDKQRSVRSEGSELAPVAPQPSPKCGIRNSVT